MQPVKLFISYAHKDETYKDELCKHLSVLQRNKIIDAWQDREIVPGMQWDDEIKSALEQAEVILFLISSDFMSSDYIHDVEIKNAIERYKAKTCTIVPIIIRRCHFQDLEIGDFQALPKDADPISSWENKDDAWYNVVEGLKKVIIELRGVAVLPDFDVDTSSPSDTPSKVVLHDYHQFSCDRREQLGSFEEIYEAKQNQKVQFYYLLGEEEQAHFGFVNRLAYEQGGHLLDIDNPNPQTSKLLIEDIILENISGLGHLKKRLVRELMAKMEINVNAHDPILDKNLDFICQHSPVIQRMGIKDFVCIQLSIYEDEWDEDETPALARWFIHTFCQSDLATNSPNFLIFFSIIYTDRDPDIIEAVAKEVSNSDVIDILPELKMVTIKDVNRWFRKYKIIAPDREVKDNLMQEHFSSGEEFDMESIQIKLRKIIDQFNKKTD